MKKPLKRSRRTVRPPSSDPSSSNTIELDVFAEVIGDPLAAELLTRPTHRVETIGDPLQAKALTRPLKLRKAAKPWAIKLILIGAALLFGAATAWSPAKDDAVVTAVWKAVGPALQRFLLGKT